MMGFNPDTGKGIFLMHSFRCYDDAIFVYKK